MIYKFYIFCIIIIIKKKIYKDIEKELMTYQKHFESKGTNIEEDVCIIMYIYTYKNK